MQAFVLIQTKPGNGRVGEALRAMPAVVSADDLTGPYDAIAVAKADSIRDLFDSVVPRIRELPGVIQALPAPLARAFAEGDRSPERVPAGEAA